METRIESLPGDPIDYITTLAGKPSYRSFRSTCHFFHDPKKLDLHEQYLNTHKIFTNGKSIFFILKNGELLAYGDNTLGQLGIGSTDHLTAPTLINLDKSYTPIAMVLGDNHSLLLTDKGEILTCGCNFTGQLGLGCEQTVNTFVKVNLDSVLLNDELIVAVKAGPSQSLLLTNKGQVLICGDYEAYLSDTKAMNYEAFSLVDLSNVLKNREIVVAMTSSRFYSLLLTNKGQVLISDKKFAGLCNKLILLELSNVLLENEIIVAISTSTFHYLLLTNKGQVLTSGDNPYGQLGLGNSVVRNKFTRVDLSSVLTNNETIVAVVAHGYCSYLLTDRGRVLVCGKNSNDHFGFGNKKNVSLFTEVDLSKILERNESIVAIKPGDNDLLLTDKGRVITWGKDHFAGNKKDLFTALDVDFLKPKEELSQSNCMTNSL